MPKSGDMVLCTLFRRLLRNRNDPQKPQTNIYTDSQLVVGHLTRRSKVRAKNLLVLHEEAASGLRKTGANLIWVPREQIVKKLGH